MKAFEFSTDHVTGQAQYRRIGENTVNELTENDSEIIQIILEYSKQFHTEQYEAVTEIYKSSSLNRRYYDFVRARRIANCCYGESDMQPDVDSAGARHYEFVKCPIMAECKWFKIICQPKFNSKLSNREKEVMQLYFEGLKTEKIADALFLSIHTVNNHRCSSFVKLGLHSLDEFIDFAHKNKMFN